jgi:3-phenylpropionate/trans-cinnamate dioxygenase ferredoxin subunit
MTSERSANDASRWVVACRSDQIEPEDVLRFDFDGRSFVVIRSPDGAFFAIDGHCSHEKIHLADGLVDGNIIECPRHFGTFDYRTGESRNLPACIDLRTYPVREENGQVLILL